MPAEPGAVGEKLVLERDVPGGRVHLLRLLVEEVAAGPGGRRIAADRRPRVALTGREHDVILAGVQAPGQPPREHTSDRGGGPAGARREDPSLLTKAAPPPRRGRR